MSSREAKVLQHIAQRVRDELSVVLREVGDHRENLVSTGEQGSLRVRAILCVEVSEIQAQQSLACGAIRHVMRRTDYASHIAALNPNHQENGEEKIQLVSIRKVF